MNEDITGTCSCGARILRRYDWDACRTTWQHGEGEAVFTMTDREIVEAELLPGCEIKPLHEWIARVHEYERGGLRGDEVYRQDAQAVHRGTGGA